MIQKINFKALGYVKTPTLPDMIKSLECVKIQSNMKMVQCDEFNRIRSSFTKKGHLQENTKEYVKQLYLNFVLKPIVKVKTKSNERIIDCSNYYR